MRVIELPGLFLEGEEKRPIRKTGGQQAV